MLLSGMAAALGMSACGARDGGTRLGDAAAALRQGADGEQRDAMMDRRDTHGNRTVVTGDELQSRKDKELMLLFIALLQMDKKAGLALTAAEAAAIVPAVKAGKEKGELSPEEKQQVFAALTNEQVRFLTEFRERVTTQRRKLRELSPEERASMIEQFKQRRKQEESGMKPDNDEPDKSGDWAAGAPRGGAAGGKNPDRTVEQQLLDLLEAKVSESKQPAQPSQSSQPK